MEYKRLKEINFAESLNNRVYGIFLARDVDVRLQKDGKTKFISLNMCDRDIKLEAKRFGASDQEIETMKNGAVYQAAIDVKEYAKSSTGYSCILYNFEPVDIQPSEFIEWTDGMEEAHRIIQNALNVISESIYKQLVGNLILANWQAFSVWPAASSFHHYAMGGLMVHTAEVIEQSEIIADMWESKYGPYFINKPLLLSAALLHDIAKVRELAVDVKSGATEYSTEAALGTHITMGVSMIDIEAYRIHFGYQTYNINEINEEVGLKSAEQLAEEAEALNLLKHCILAHHGKKEYGSPIDMNCPEAYIIHIADEISAEMFRYNKNFASMEPGTSNSVWLGGNIVSTYKDSTKE